MIQRRAHIKADWRRRQWKERNSILLVVYIRFRDVNLTTLWILKAALHGDITLSLDGLR